MSKNTLRGAFSRTQNTAFVSPDLAQNSPLGVCLKALTEPADRDELRNAKEEIDALLFQIADTLDVIAERENLIEQNPPLFSTDSNVGSAAALMAAMLRLTADMNTALNQKMEGKQ